MHWRIMERVAIALQRQQDEQQLRVLQMALAGDFNHSFDSFVQRMAAAPIETDAADGALRYTSLYGDVAAR